MYHKTNRETMVEISDSVRGKDVYIIQTGTKYENCEIFQYLIMVMDIKHLFIIIETVIIT